MGSTAIQLAVASGLDVVSTASKKNLDYVRFVGAKYVFDYAEESVVEDIVSLLKGNESGFVGAYDAISLPETLKATGEIVDRLGGGKIVTVLPTAFEGFPSSVKALGGKCYFIDQG